MASSTAPRSGGEGKAREGADLAALSEEMGELRAELGRIAGLVGEIASNRVEGVREQAYGLAEDVANRGQALREEAFARVGALEEEVERVVRERPVTAVAVALGVGFLFGALSRH